MALRGKITRCAVNREGKNGSDIILGSLQISNSVEEGARWVGAGSALKLSWEEAETGKRLEKKLLTTSRFLLILIGGTLVGADNLLLLSDSPLPF